MHDVQNLSEAGSIVLRSIHTILESHGVDTSVIRVYSETNWMSRNETHGRDAELVLSYGSNEVRLFFEGSMGNPRTAQMDDALGMLGFSCVAYAGGYCGIFDMARTLSTSTTEVVDRFYTSVEEQAFIDSTFLQDDEMRPNTLAKEEPFSDSSFLEYFLF